MTPSEQHPLSATDFYQVLETSDLPPGFVNIVTGKRDALSKTLAGHDDVRFLQAAVGCAVDAQFGPESERAAAECDLVTTTAAYCDAEEWPVVARRRDPKNRLFSTNIGPRVAMEAQR